MSVLVKGGHVVAGVDDYVADILIEREGRTIVTITAERWLTSDCLKD